MTIWQSIPASVYVHAGSALNRHGIGQQGQRRTLSMGVVKEDDGDLDKALAYHRERMVSDGGASGLGGRLTLATGRRVEAR